jgi:hypothetical protein
MAKELNLKPQFLNPPHYFRKNNWPWRKRAMSCIGN